MKRSYTFFILTACAALMAGCGKDDGPEKQDVRIGWTWDNTANQSDRVLSDERIAELKAKPTTKDIVAYVLNNQSPAPKLAITLLVNDLVQRKEQGVKFEPGTMYVNDFEKADSIKAKQQLSLTIDLKSRRPE